MSKKRIKNNTPLVIPVPNWDEADAMLRRIGDLQLEINRCEQTAKVKIDEAKLELAESVKPLQEKIKLHTQSIEAFATNNRKDFGRAQTMALTFGNVGWRKSTSISIKKSTLGLIKSIFGNKAKLYIRCKEAVDKDGLKSLTDEQLRSISARRKSKEAFFVEPDIPEAVDYED